MASRAGIETGPGGQRGHQGGDAHDKGAAAEGIALTDGGHPEQQVEAEQGTATQGTQQLATGEPGLVQPGQGQQDQRRQQEAAADKGGGRQLTDRLLGEEPASGRQQGGADHQQ